MNKQQMPDTAIQEKTPNTLISLSVAKAVGIIFIVVAHIDQVLGITDALDASILANHLAERLFHVIGHYGVSLFIVSSGFGLTYSLLRKDKRISGEWFTRRITRIYILFWISYAFFIILLGLRPEGIDLSMEEFIVTLLGIQAFFGYWGGHVNGVYWFNTLILSLYVVFPVLFWLLRKGGQWKLLLILIVSLVSGYFILENVSLDAFRYLVVSRAFEFSAGIVLAYIYYRRGELLKQAWRGWVFLGLAAAIFAAYFYLLNSPALIALVLLSGPLLFVGLFALMDYVPARSWLNPAILFLEKHAHALFLFHLPFLPLFKNLISVSRVSFIIVYLVTVTVVAVAAQYAADKIHPLLRKMPGVR